MQAQSSNPKIIKLKKIVHYRTNCIGCGMCSYYAPKYWELSEKDGLANLKAAKQVKDTFQKEIEPGDEQQNQNAAKNCPVNIIKIC